ncbi:unnamed protein product [Litomosoides sigmodontis]|uniref:Uncharacterized protein n=1 Tax=Litomosoides sigmodontis TaxID=42156 RepID=A0A3P6U236_LITSI|nr:unnamed protein product [Litomosoides sigmodontis]
MLSSIWPVLFTQVQRQLRSYSHHSSSLDHFCKVRIARNIVGRVITYLISSNAATLNEPKKAVVEHSIRLSFRNDLPKSEGSGEYSLKTTAKHHPKTAPMNPDETQSGAVGSKNLALSKHTPKLYLQAQTVVGKSTIARSEKLTDDKTQISALSADFTQLTAGSEGNDKQSSKTLTESTVKENRNRGKLKSQSEYGKALQESVTQNISISQLLSAAQSKKKQQSEVEESGSTEESIASPADDPKRSSKSPARSTQPG